MVRRCVSTVLPIGSFWKNKRPQTAEHMVEVKRIRAPSDIMVKLDEFAARAGRARISGLVRSGRTLVECRRVALGIIRARSGPGNASESRRQPHRFSAPARVLHQ